MATWDNHQVRPTGKQQTGMHTVLLLYCRAPSLRVRPVLLVGILHRYIRLC